MGCVSIDLRWGMGDEDFGVAGGRLYRLSFVLYSCFDSLLFLNKKSNGSQYL